MVSIPKGIFYYVGEKPPPLPCRYEDADGNLITAISAATINALVNIEGDAGGEQTVSCTNNADGTFTIDWDTGTSNMKLDAGTDRGMMRVDVEITDAPRKWYMDRFSIPIIRRK